MNLGGTTVVSVEFTPLDIPLRVPFGIAGGAQDVARNVLVTVTLADGTVGYGEAAPLPAYNGETQARVLAALERMRAAVLGREVVGESEACARRGAAVERVAMEQRDVADWRVVAALARAADGGSGSALAALEMALLDALTRRRGEPLWTFFGGAGVTLETDMTVTTGSTADAAEAARDIGRRGIRMIKVKVGGPRGAAHDLARLAAIHAVAPGAPLILDGNAGVSRAQARELVEGLRALGIVPALLEQWLAKDDLEGMRALGAESGWPVAADEAACTADDVRRIAAAGAAQFINIKLMKAGVAEALDLVAAARAAGLGLMIGGNVESILAMTVSACFAAGLGGFTFADLDTPLFLAENPFEGGYALDGGTISVGHIKAGHGVRPARLG